MTTTEFIAQHTEAGGTVLRMRDENNRACIFLGQQGCSVHPDRPLACRLYPLARWVDPDGHESFGHLIPHTETEGVYGASATVDNYLRQQGVAPFFEMGDRYGAVYQRMVDVLKIWIRQKLTVWVAGMTWTRPNQAWPLSGLISTKQLPTSCITHG